MHAIYLYIYLYSSSMSFCCGVVNEVFYRCLGIGIVSEHDLRFQLSHKACTLVNKINVVMLMYEYFLHNIWCSGAPFKTTPVS